MKRLCYRELLTTGIGEEKTKVEKKDEEMKEQSVNDQTDNAQTTESVEA